MKSMLTNILLVIVAVEGAILAWGLYREPAAAVCAMDETDRAAIHLKLDGIVEAVVLQDQGGPPWFKPTQEQPELPGTAVALANLAACKASDAVAILQESGLTPPPTSD